MNRTATSSILSALLVVAGATAARASGTALTVGEVTGLYRQIHERLAADSIEGVAEAAAAIAEKVRPCECGGDEKSAYEALGAAARAMTGSDLATLRDQFDDVSRALAAFLEATGFERSQLYYCSMAKGYWLQDRSDAAVRNPYLGKAMLACGSKVEGVSDRAPAHSH